MLNNEYTKLEIRKLTFKSQEIMHQWCRLDSLLNRSANMYVSIYFFLNILSCLVIKKNFASQKKVDAHQVMVDEGEVRASDNDQ